MRINLETNLEVVHNYGHMAYLAAVFVESHGTYGIIAGGLLVVMVCQQYYKRRKKTT